MAPPIDPPLRRRGAPPASWAATAGTAPSSPAAEARPPKPPAGATLTRIAEVHAQAGLLAVDVSERDGRCFGLLTLTSGTRSASVLMGRGSVANLRQALATLLTKLVAHEAHPKGTTR